MDKISSYWFRRGKIEINRKTPKELELIQNYLENEREIINQYLHHKIKPKSLNNYYNSEPNKLIVLDEARKIGIKIPRTFILDSKKELNKILIKFNLITKTITSSGVFDFGNSSGIIYTNEISKHSLDSIPSNFFPTLFQKKINKIYEIRAFILGDKIWSMAIFSQKDKKTQIDFRRYNNLKPNRTVPYLLPKRLEKKLLKLMKTLNLKSGSIDLLVSRKKEYYFLEVNPIGQFGMVSAPCNYNIDLEIAKILQNES